jgi:hypothetical protein
MSPTGTSSSTSNASSSEENRLTEDVRVARGSSGDRRDDFRRIKNLHYLTTDLVQHVAEACPALKGYVELRGELPAHGGIRTRDPALKERHDCTVLHCSPSWRIANADRLAPLELHLGAYVEDRAGNDRQGSVLVFIRESHERQQRILGGLPSDVCVARLDEVGHRRINSGQSARDVLIEILLSTVDGELNAPLDAFIKRARRSPTVTYELPGNVVKDASVVVNSVPEPSGELPGEIRPALPNDDLATKDGADLEVGRLAVWIDPEGWLGASVEEPIRLTAGGARVQVGPLKLYPSAAEMHRSPKGTMTHRRLDRQTLGVFLRQPPLVTARR